jgi:citrate lyase gamma subunit
VLRWLETIDLPGMTTIRTEGTVAAIRRCAPVGHDQGKRHCPAIHVGRRADARRGVALSQGVRRQYGRTTLKPTIKKVLNRLPVRRVIVIADRGLLSIDNLAELQAMTLLDGAPLEFILVVPGRRYNDVVESLHAIHMQQCRPARQS